MNSLDPKLAKYLSASKQEIYDEYHGKKKSKKRKQADPDGDSILHGNGFRIAGLDDDEGNGFGWGAKRKLEDEEDTALGGVHVVANVRSNGLMILREVVEHRKSVFKPIASISTPGPSASAVAQEAIPDDEAPQVVGSVVQDGPRGNAAEKPALQGGLQTAAALRAEKERRRELEAARKKAIADEAATARRQRAGSGAEDGPMEEQTIYRDKSGRKIDTKAERAELARQRRAEVEKEMQKMEWGKGLVQREDKERRQRELEDMASKPMARYADDDDMNDEMRDRDRWNDPAAAFLTEKKGKTKSKAPQRPKYSGPMPAPNRFGILPGYRYVSKPSSPWQGMLSFVVRSWDGVDRSIGFERDLMQAGNLKKIQAAQARVFSTEDM